MIKCIYARHGIGAALKEPTLSQSLPQKTQRQISLFSMKHKQNKKCKTQIQSRPDIEHDYYYYYCSLRTSLKNFCFHFWFSLALSLSLSRGSVFTLLLWTHNWFGFCASWFGYNFIWWYLLQHTLSINDGKKSTVNKNTSTHISE